MALDVYTWLTYRMSYLKASTEIPWAALQRQFGAGYPETAQGLRDFRKKYVVALRKVLTIYAEARVEPLEQGIRMTPSRPHVRKKVP